MGSSASPRLARPFTPAPIDATPAHRHPRFPRQHGLWLQVLPPETPPRCYLSWHRSDAQPDASAELCLPLPFYPRISHKTPTWPWRLPNMALWTFRVAPRMPRGSNQMASAAFHMVTLNGSVAANVFPMAISLVRWYRGCGKAVRS